MLSAVFYIFDEVRYDALRAIATLFTIMRAVNAIS